MDSWDAPKFDDLYRNFIVGSTGGKIFMMKKLEKGETLLGKGVVILLQKATPFLLTVLKEQYLIDKDVMIGDITMLLQLVNQQQVYDLKKRNQKRINNSIRVPKTKLQLHNILRQQKSLNPKKIQMKLKKVK
ncbi:MAG: hypothetical protein P8P29_05810 [Flavobacteriaceae bacterium]|nr:hypothetical protein [Flavobacteriaceae bacterium]